MAGAPERNRPDGPGSFSRPAPSLESSRSVTIPSPPIPGPTHHDDPTGPRRTPPRTRHLPDGPGRRSPRRSEGPEPAGRRQRRSASGWASSGLMTRWSGSGSVKVAVLDYGFDGLGAGRGYLPDSSEVVEDYDSEFVRRFGLGDPEYRKPFEPGNRHGREMAQIVWSVSGSRPEGPKFYLLNANGPTMLRRAIRYAIEKHVDLILFSRLVRGRRGRRRQRADRSGRRRGRGPGHPLGQRVGQLRRSGLQRPNPGARRRLPPAPKRARRRRPPVPQPGRMRTPSPSP